jgi:hypothetical protein
VGAGALARAATAPQGRGLAGAGLLAHPAPGKLNAIVKSINEQIDFDALLHTILHESTIIKGIDSALALVREDGTETLSLRAAWGRIDAAADAYRIDLRQAELRYAPPPT